MSAPTVPVEAILAEVLTPRAVRRWLAAQTSPPVLLGHHLFAEYLGQFFPGQYIYTPSHSSVCIGPGQCYLDPTWPCHQLPEWAARFANSFPFCRIDDPCWWQERAQLEVPALLQRFDALIPEGVS